MSSDDERSRWLRESVDDDNMMADRGEPEESAGGQVADAGTCMGSEGWEGRSDGRGYNKTKHDECPDVQAANRKNATKIDGQFSSVARPELSR